MSQRKLIVAAVFAAPLAAAWPAAAQDAAAKQYVDIAIVEPPKKSGLELTLKNGATISLVDSRDVVGVQPNGATYTFGLKFDGTAIYRKGNSEWRNILGASASLSRTPALPEIVKSADALAFESTYLYFVKPWFGPFGRFTAATPMFRGYDVRAADTTYDVTLADGSKDPNAPKGPVHHLDLTDPFRPLTMKETVGPFLRPVTGEKWNVEARVGVGGLQTLAEGQRLLKDDDTTKDKVEVTTLSNVFQVGGEGSLETWGAIYAKKISYKAGIGVLVPFWSNDKDVSPAKLTNIDVGVGISIKVVEWATLDYELKAVRQPQLTDVWQIRNGFMLTLGLGYDNKPKKPEPAPAAK